MALIAEQILNVDPAVQADASNDATRKMALRASGCWLGTQVTRALGPDWDEQLGIDPNRADQWAVSRLSDSTSIPSPREILAMARVIGLDATTTFRTMVGSINLMVLQPEVDLREARNRSRQLVRRVQFPEKCYRGVEITAVLERLESRYSSTEARRYLAQRMGVTERTLGQIARDQVAVSAWADAALALELGRPIALHWRLVGSGNPDEKAFLFELNEAHKAEGRVKRGLVAMAFEGTDAIKITPDDVENSFLILPFQAQISLQEGLAFRQLDETLVLQGKDGQRWSFQVRLGRIDREAASEAGVDDSPWLDYCLYRLDRDGWVTGPHTGGKPATWERLADEVAALLPEGLETPVVGLKIQLPDVRRHAVGFERKIVSFR